MVREQRHQEITNLLRIRRQISVQELTQKLGVTEVTIRKDLTFLEDTGTLMRVHGGALLAEDRNNFTPIVKRYVEKLDEKNDIAARANKMVRDGDTIFVNSGSTCAQLAKHLRSKVLRVVCHSVGVISHLIDAPNIALITLGGNYRKEAGSFIGPIALNNLKKFHFDLCFVGVKGFTDDGCFFSENIIEAEVKTAALKISDRRIILADSGKFNQRDFTVFADDNDVDLLITNRGIPRESMTSVNYEIICV